MLSLIVVKDNEGIYHTTGKDRQNELIFSGSGKTLIESIGAFIVSNREELEVTFLIDEPSKEIMLSTHYAGRELTEYEQEYLKNKS